MAWSPAGNDQTKTRAFERLKGCLLSIDEAAYQQNIAEEAEKASQKKAFFLLHNLRRSS
jgi:hypothetical protein